MKSAKSFHFPLLGRYLLTYMGIFVFVVGSLLLLKGEILQVTRRNALAAQEKRVQEGIERFTDLAGRMLSTMYILRDESDVQRLMTLSPGSKAAYVPHLIGAQKMVTQVRTLLGDDILNCSLLFRNNDFWITSHTSGRVNMRDYQLLSAYTQMDVETWYARLFASPDDVAFWPDMAVQSSYFGSNPKRVLTCVVKLKDRLTFATTGALAFLLDSERVVDILLGDALRSNVILYLVDGGNVLLHHGSEALDALPATLQGGEELSLSGERYTLLQCAAPAFNLHAVVAIPNRIIILQADQILRMVNLYILCCVVAGLLLALLYAARHYLQVTRLLAVSQQVTNRPFPRTNEYRFLGDVLKDIGEANGEAAQRLLLMENEQRARLLAGACLYGIYSNTERLQLRELLGEHLHCFRIVVIAYEADAAQAAYEAEELLALRMNHITWHPAHNEIACIVAVNPAEEERPGIEAALGQLRAIFTAQGLNAYIGVSARGEGENSVHRAYQQARRAPYTSDRAWQYGIHWAQANGLPEPPFDLYAPQALYNLLLAGDAEGTAQLFKTVMQGPQRSGLEYLQAFGSLRLSLERAAADISADVSIPPFAADEPYGKAMEGLLQSALRLIQTVQEGRRSGNLSLKNAILAYIAEQYVDPNLSAGTIASHFNVSEKYVFHFLKEQTGRTLGAHIEDKRLAAARHFLEQHTLSNEEIARRCGFGTTTTFYRAFKRRFGVAPSAFRGQG